METSWFMDIVRSLFAYWDSFIYLFISIVYNLINDIAHFRVFDSETLANFSSRIYAILGIFMLFKLSFSFVNYLINPDSFTDKEKGAQNIIKNVVIMFAMLIVCPWCFNTLWELQATILDERIIENFVFGELDGESPGIKYSPVCDDSYVIPVTSENAGNMIALLTFRGFYQPLSSDESEVDLDENADYREVVDDLCERSQLSVGAIVGPSKIHNGTVNISTSRELDLNAALTTGVFFLLGMGETYVMNYLFGISTAVGVVVLLILVGFAMDAGARMVKLSFLQLIAPVPIVSYIDPASGKNGIFKKWIIEVGSTWASLFIRLLALFFAVSVIQQIGSLTSVGEERTASFWVDLFVVIGALMFAKQLPQLIQDITGIKLGGSFTLNPFKKIENEALGGKQIIGGARRVARGAGGLVVGGALGIASGLGGGHAAWSAVKGAGSGFFGNKKVGDIRNDQADYNKKMRMARMKGSTLGGRVRSGVADYLGRQDDLGRILQQEYDFDEQIRQEKDALYAANEPLESTIRSENQAMLAGKEEIDNQNKVKESIKAIKDISKDAIEKGKAGSYSQDYLARAAAVDALENDLQNGVLGVTADMVAEEKMALGKFLKEQSAKFEDAIYNGHGKFTDVNGSVIENSDLKNALDNYERNVQTYGANYAESRSVANNAADRKTQMENITNRTEKIARANMQHEYIISNTQLQVDANKTAHEATIHDIEEQKRQLDSQKQVAQANSDMAAKLPGSVRK